MNEMNIDVVNIYNYLQQITVLCLHIHHFTPDIPANQVVLEAINNFFQVSHQYIDDIGLYVEHFIPNNQVPAIPGG